MMPTKSLCNRIIVQFLRPKTGLLLLGSLSFWAMQASAFELDGPKWLGAETRFYANMDGFSATGISWNFAFVAALNEWNQKTPFNFLLRQTGKDPCLADGVSGVDFKQDLCGSEFGSNTLAVTFRRQLEQQLLGEPYLTETDIVINQSENFDIYDGTLNQTGVKGLDFRRVALHELGHVLGLGHEAGKPAIMNPNIGNVDRLQPDDVRGVEALYGGLSNCTIRNLSFGLTVNALDATDCTVQELTVGSTDTSFIDLYRFDLLTETELEFKMTSSSLDSVLILADTQLRFLGFDDKSSNLCDSSLVQTLPPGSYFLLANTYDVPQKEECGNLGEYQLSASFSSAGLVDLGETISLGNGDSSAGFKGGITGDNGQSYGNQFTPNESLDISAEITIDPAHQGEAGFLVVAALVGEQILLLNQQGQFVDSAANPGFIERAANKTLAAVEQLSIASNLKPAALGVQDIIVNFIVGYGLNNDPEEVYYHQIPLNLVISP